MPSSGFEPAIPAATGLRLTSYDHWDRLVECLPTAFLGSCFQTSLFAATNITSVLFFTVFTYSARNCQRRGSAPRVLTFVFNPSCFTYAVRSIGCHRHYLTACTTQIWQAHKTLLFSKTLRTSLGPAHPPIQWVPGLLPGGKTAATRISPLTSNLLSRLRARGAVLQLRRSNFIARTKSTSIRLFY